MRSPRTTWAAAMVMGCMATSAAYCQPTIFTETFDGPGLVAELIDPLHAFSFNGGAAVPHGPRAYIQTRATDYVLHDFTADAVFISGGGVGAAGLFFGIGSAERDPLFYYEPRASAFLLDLAPDFPSTDTLIRVRPNTQNSPEVGPVLGFWPSPLGGRQHARMQKCGDVLTFAFDYQYDGVAFRPDYAMSFDVQRDLAFLNPSLSRVFIGADASGTRILELAVRAEVRPVILTSAQPRRQTCPDEAIEFAVEAFGALSLSYEWQAQIAGEWRALGEKGVDAPCEGGGDGVIFVATQADAPMIFIGARGCRGAQTWPLRCVVRSECGESISELFFLAICPPDLDCDGRLNSADFFALLEAFFREDPFADFNRDGQVNSQDFFDFLAAFFAGC